MNTAYKWYSHNSSIIQFYSGSSYVKRTERPVEDYAHETVNQAYDYSVGIITLHPEVNVN